MNEFNYDDSAYLAHHGVKGMKWGVRKDRSAYRSDDERRQRRRTIAKRIAIGTGIAAGVAGAGLGAYAIGKHLKTSEKRRISNARKQYKDTQATIDFIKNSPYSHHAGDKYAKKPDPAHYDVGRVKSTIGAIKASNPRSNHRASARAQYIQKNNIVNSIKNSSSSNHQSVASPSYRMNNARQQYNSSQSVVDMIKNNPNSHHTDDRIAKKYRR